VADVVDTYKYTLRSVPADHQPVFTASSLRQNRRIRAVLRRLEPREYRVAPTSLWPTASEAMGAFPTLMYRLLQRGNVDALCHIVVVDHRKMPASGRKRGRASAVNRDERRS
jgi:hypothetical protein